MRAPTLRPRQTGAPEQGTRFVPIAEEAHNEAPRATIDPDRSLSWLRRALPVMKAHKGIFITSLTLSFLGLVLQVQIPNLLQQAIGNSITHHTVPLSHYVWWIVGLGLVGGVAGYIARLFLFETAYDIEYDLRNIIYEHLTRMSFSFYDRVQSGQLISRANSDIRSVQMYMTFAPADPGAVLHRGGGLHLHADHQRAPGLHRHGHHAVRLHHRRQDAEVDVPGVVDHPGPAGRGGHHRRRERQRGAGGQVVRRRAAAAAGPVRCGRKGPVGLHQRRRPAGPVHPAGPEPAPARVGPGPAVRRLHGHPRPAWDSAPSWPSTPTS